MENMIEKSLELVKSYKDHLKSIVERKEILLLLMKFYNIKCSQMDVSRKKIEEEVCQINIIVCLYNKNVDLINQIVDEVHKESLEQCNTYKDHSKVFYERKEVLLILTEFYISKHLSMMLSEKEIEEELLHINIIVYLYNENVDLFKQMVDEAQKEEKSTLEVLKEYIIAIDNLLDLEPKNWIHQYKKKLMMGLVSCVEEESIFIKMCKSLAGC